MANRFFKLLYVLSLIVIGLSLPIYFFSSVDFSKVTISTYKARCISNNQYVVLEGSSSSSQSQAYTFEETSLDNNPFIDLKNSLNFYCKYYNDVQPYINGYAASTTDDERKLVNLSFYQFQNSQVVDAYPQLYKLDIVSERKNYNEILYPLGEWLVVALIAFAILQILKISYLYVKFGEVVWNPFRSSKKK